MVTLWDLGSLDQLSEMLEKCPVDVVLMDLNLGPEQDALAATKAIRERFDGVKVIIVSGSLDFEWAAASRAAGAAGYLPKDLSFVDMLATIRGLASLNFGKGFSDMLSERTALSGSRESVANTLTRREQQVLAELRRGRTNREIAARLGVSITTVNKHVQQVLKKLQVRTRAQAVVAVELQVSGRPYVRAEPVRS